MHSNLRILYVLIAPTAALGLGMQMQQPAGLLGNVAGTDFAVGGHVVGRPHLPLHGWQPVSCWSVLKREGFGT